MKSQIRIIIVEESFESAMDISYKHLDFESQPETAEAIKSKCSHLMLFINSAKVNEFNPSQDTTSKWSRKLYQKTLTK